MNTDGREIYAIELIHNPNNGILSSDCKEIRVMKDGSIIYFLDNTKNVIKVEERWIFIPYHAISRIMFKTEFNEKMDDISNRT